MPSPSVTLQVASEPFPHAVIDGWWGEALLERVAGEFPDHQDPRWRRYENSQERKLEGPPPMWGQATQELFAEIDERAADLERGFGIQGLSMETVGGGYHLIPPGGYLDVHADFNRSPQTGQFRRLNLLIYLNPGWDDPGGHLELWGAAGREVDVVPEFNRTVVFETSSRSWHGHPRPAARWRKSVAAYFFTKTQPDGYRADHSTVWYRDAR
jgi:Rps23 Pro-64 3,4-dihydroxylase Tpa1-like proline 4-hydroxylase